MSISQEKLNKLDAQQAIANAIIRAEFGSTAYAIGQTDGAIFWIYNNETEDNCKVFYTEILSK